MPEVVIDAPSLLTLLNAVPDADVVSEALPGGVISAGASLSRGMRLSLALAASSRVGSIPARSTNFGAKSPLPGGVFTEDGKITEVDDTE